MTHHEPSTRIAATKGEELCAINGPPDSSNRPRRFLLSHLKTLSPPHLRILQVFETSYLHERLPGLFGRLYDVGDTELDPQRQWFDTKQPRWPRVLQISRLIRPGGWRGSNHQAAAVFIGGASCHVQVACFCESVSSAAGCCYKRTSRKELRIEGRGVLEVQRAVPRTLNKLIKSTG